MPAVFSSRWSRGTILAQALQKAANKKITHLGRDKLNRVLEDLYSQWEWPFLYKEYQFGFSGNQFSLPDDFLKAESETGLRVLSRDGNVLNTPVVEVDPVTFRRRGQDSSQTTSDRPLLYYVDYAQRLGHFWPIPTSACVGSLFYKFLPLDMSIGSGSDATTTAYDADIPLFPWGSYLAMEIEVWAYEYDQNTTRARDARALADTALARIRGIAMPRLSQSPTLDLDPTVFGPAFRGESD